MRRVSTVAALTLALVAACDGSPTEAGATPDAPEAIPAAAAPASACDPDKVAALHEALIGADARARREAVRTGLGDACALPEFVSDYVAAERGQRGLSRTSPEFQKAARVICPGAAVIMRQASAVEGKKRAALIYDRCDFSRFDLIGRAQFVDQTDGPLVPFYAYEWMTGIGVPDDHAKAIARGLLLADRTDWNGDRLTLPSADYAVGPVPETVAVRITSKGIVIEGELHVELDSASVPSDIDSILLPVLKEMRPRGDVGGRLIIAADKDALPSVLRSVIHTAGRAGYLEFALLAEQAPMVFGAVAVGEHVGSSTVSGAPRMSVVIDAKGYALRDSTPASGEPQLIAGADASNPWDYAALGASAAAFKAKHGKVGRAVVAVADGVPYDVLLHSVVGLRGEGCDVDGTCVFPKVYLSTVDLAESIRIDPRFVGMLADGTGHFKASPYGSVFSPAGEEADVWGGLTGEEVGRAYGVGGTFGSRGKRVPRVRQAKAKVKGALDRDIIRRIVRAHINEVRSCYSAGLAKDAKLEGRIEIDFTIGSTGKVTKSKVGSTTLANPSVERCIAKAVKRWKFPRPRGGGVVTVSYPFNLSPG